MQSTDNDLEVLENVIAGVLLGSRDYEKSAVADDYATVKYRREDREKLEAALKKHPLPEEFARHRVTADMILNAKLNEWNG